MIQQILVLFCKKDNYINNIIKVNRKTNDDDSVNTRDDGVDDAVENGPNFKEDD